MSVLQKDTTMTKIFVGGLPYHTTDDTLRQFFDKFGEIEEAVVITDRQTGKSRGYGFVTMSERAAAERACKDPNPIIDGRKANVNLAYLGAKPRTLAHELLAAFPLSIKTANIPSGYAGQLTRFAQFAHPSAYMTASGHTFALPGPGPGLPLGPSQSSLPSTPSSAGLPFDYSSGAAGGLAYPSYPVLYGYESAQQPAYPTSQIIGYLAPNGNLYPATAVPTNPGAAYPTGFTQSGGAIGPIFPASAGAAQCYQAQTGALIHERMQ